MFKHFSRISTVKKAIINFLIAAGLLVSSAGAFAGRQSLLVTGFGAKAVDGVVVPAVDPASVPAEAVSLDGFPEYAFSDEAALGENFRRAINASQKSVELFIYSFTLPDVAQALIKARDRGVAVRVILNQGHVFTKNRSEAINTILKAGIEIRTLRGTWTYGVNHNKIGIYDRKLISAGSCNWSNNATDNNYENQIFVKKPSTVKGYCAYFDYAWEAARTYAEGPIGEISTGTYATPPTGPAVYSFGGERFPEYSFSPLGGSRELLLKAINGAKKKIDVASFTFSDRKITLALGEAVKRGVKVRVLTDKATAKTRGFVSWLVPNGIETRLCGGRKGGSMHHKFAIFDGVMLETGSHNWTGNADINDFENIYYTKSSSYIAGFQKKFEELYAKGFAPDLNVLPAPEDMTLGDDAPIPQTRTRSVSGFDEVD